MTCPFCGSKRNVRDNDYQSGPPYYMRCKNCNATGPEADTISEAIQLYDNGFFNYRARTIKCVEALKGAENHLRAYGYTAVANRYMVVLKAAGEEI